MPPPHKAQNFYYLTLYRKSLLTPDLNHLNSTCIQAINPYEVIMILRNWRMGREVNYALLSSSYLIHDNHWQHHWQWTGSQNPNCKGQIQIKKGRVNKIWGDKFKSSELSFSYLLLFYLTLKKLHQIKDYVDIKLFAAWFVVWTSHELSECPWAGNWINHCTPTHMHWKMIY